jgi:hemolysin III
MGLRDPVSSASHLLTALWAMYATLILIRLTPARSSRRVAVAVFGFAMVLLYLASGTFHGVPFSLKDDPGPFRFFQKIDQSAIFLLIAGTNTPCLVVLLGGAWAKWFLRLMWGVVAIGIGCIWVLPKSQHWLLVTNYLVVGWLGVLPVFHYYRAVGWRAMNWMWLGAGLYTVGAICELCEWPVISEWPVRFGYHEVLHLFDSAATIVFFVFVVRYVVPFEPAPGSLPDQDHKSRELVVA